MTTETCRHGTVASVQMLARLPESQGGVGRHKCAACAFVQGRRETSLGTVTHGSMIQCDHGKVAPESILLHLLDNQGGAGRHKCVICAYQEGRASERGVATEAAWEPRRRGECLVLLEESRPTEASIPDTVTDPARKKEIGDLGEQIVMEFEKNALIAAGRIDLANRVTHVALTEGDSAGYDIQSYDPSGPVKHIEVKTTTSTRDTAFYITENERRFGDSNRTTYHIYRLFDLDETAQEARFFVISGAPTDNLSLVPVAYRALLAASKESE